MKVYLIFVWLARSVRHHFVITFLGNSEKLALSVEMHAVKSAPDFSYYEEPNMENLIDSMMTMSHNCKHNIRQAFLSPEIFKLSC